MNILIKDGLILTLGGGPPLSRGYVAIDNGTIVAVASGDPDQGLVDRSEKVLDAAKCVVMPGFVNSHTHMAMHFYRAFAEEQSHALYRTIVPMERAFDEESIYWASALGAIDALRSGVTCVVDHYHFADSTAKAARTLGLRALVAEKIAGFSLDAPPRWNDERAEFAFEHDPKVEESKLRTNLEFIGKWSGDRLIVPCLGPHAPDTVSKDTLIRVRDMSDKLGCRILIHCAQSQAELRRMRRVHGLGSVEFLDGLGLLRESVTAAHCVFVSDDEIGLIARSRLHVAHNPLINAKDLCFARLHELRQAGGRVSLGTDCYSMDMFEQMRWALVLGNLLPAINGQPTGPRIRAEEVLLMATSKAADFLGLSQICGKLSPGMRADLIVLDRSMTSFLPIEEVYRDVVYNCGPKDVVHVIVDGQLVVNSRHLEGHDERGLIEEATDRASHWLKKGRAVLAAQGLLARRGGET